MDPVDPPSPLIVGHRGLPRRFPDNTLEGICAAADVCDMVEIDVRRTRDGVAVLAHDAHIKGRPVIEMDWPTLSELDIGDGFHPARLDDVVQAVSGIRFNFEIKNSPDEPDYDATFEFACGAMAWATEHDVVTSFHWPTVDRIRAAHPHLTTGLLVDVRQSLGEAAEWAGREGHRVVAPHWWLLRRKSRAKTAALEDGGLQVVVWTVNDEKIARRMTRAGVAAIITDDPVGIRAAIEETG